MAFDLLAPAAYRMLAGPMRATYWVELMEDDSIYEELDPSLWSFSKKLASLEARVAS